MSPRAGRAVVALAVLVTIASAVALGRQWTEAPMVDGDSATLGGVTAHLHHAEWVEMSHVHSDGFAMPGEMMPGAPSGDEVRLGVSVTLLNTGAGTRRFSPVEEFTLIGGAHDGARHLTADTIGHLSRLGPHAAVDGTLYFDVEVPGDADPPLQLQWTRDGTTVRIALPLTTDVPGHQHG